MIFNILRPRKNGCRFPDDIFKCIFLNENVWIAEDFNVPKIRINNIPVLAQIMAGADQATSHYLNQCWTDSLTHLCATRGWWVKTSYWMTLYKMSLKSNITNSLWMRPCQLSSIYAVTFCFPIWSILIWSIIFLMHRGSVYHEASLRLIYVKIQGAVSIWRWRLTSICIPFIKLRWSHERLIIITWIPIPDNLHVFILKRAPKTKR